MAANEKKKVTKEEYEECVKVVEQIIKRRDAGVEELQIHKSPREIARWITFCVLENLVDLSEAQPFGEQPRIKISKSQLVAILRAGPRPLMFREIELAADVAKSLGIDVIF